MAAKLAQEFGVSKSARVVGKPRSNELFVVLPKSLVASAREKGAVFYSWSIPEGLEVADTEQLCRFVTSFATTEEELGQLSALLQ
ncbi:hypothetical protein BU23DRAFT_553240 [Bimuria novae-zelandiae CBS 107.79]|uniref:PLP-dependent transferase n=1 Tax=Bimuria novae-zelandiae CBS 107.79 TaxID=1447943 RepID=A0A6A5VF40_9PLEO|nr:hypothetical protein BU23DRAFT_553240 [Bimuria novae-zelandiae CBS 107.79]